MFSFLYSSVRNGLQYFLPERRGQLTSWERESLKSISGGEGYRLATPELDALLLSKFTTLSRAAGLKNPPKLVIYRDGAEEAKSLCSKTVAISTGALRRLTSEELDVLLAHEIGHALHKKTSILVSPLCAIVTLLLAIFPTKTISKILSSKEKNISNLNTLTVAATFTVCASIIGELVDIPRMAFKRTLEYDADRTAFLLTGKTEALKSLFLKFKKGEEEYRIAKPIPATSPVIIPESLPLEEKQEQNTVCRLRKELLRSHPHPEERIAHIERLEKELKKDKGLSLKQF